MSSYREKINLHKQGLTHQQIADRLGVSRQAVTPYLAKYNPAYFQIIDEKGCIFKGLREWLNKNKVTRAELVRRMGMIPHSSVVTRISCCLKGEREFAKCEIDDILAITGMTYEQAFKLG